MLKQNNDPTSHLESHPQTLAYIETTLAKKPLVFHFPDGLEQRFIHKRASDSQGFIHTGRYLLILFFIVLLCNVGFYFFDFIKQNNFALLRTTYLPLSICIIFILAAPNFPLCRRYFFHIMAPVCIYILHVVIKLTIIYNGDYADFVTYHLMMTIVLMAFGIRFVVPLFIIVLVCAGAISLLYGHYYGIDINYAKFENYYILYACVVAALVAISEWHERLAFLQELLLDHHSEKLTLLNQELARIAHEDALTGIANRRNFDDISAKEWDRSIRDKQPLTLLLVDVDFFKRFNDYYGHTAGDVCLRNVAQAIASCILRTSDIVARYGGEEFAVLLPNTESIGGIKIAQRMIEAVDHLAISHLHSDAAAHVTISIGITTVIANAQLNLKCTLDAADKALYQAKHQGRHQYVFYQADATDTPTESSSV